MPIHQTIVALIAIVSTCLVSAQTTFSKVFDNPFNENFETAFSEMHIINDTIFAMGYLDACLDCEHYNRLRTAAFDLDGNQIGESTLIGDSAMGDWNYQLSIVHRSSDTNLSFVNSANRVVAPIHQWKPGNDESQALLYEFNADGSIFSVDTLFEYSERHREDGHKFILRGGFEDAEGNYIFSGTVGVETGVLGQGVVIKLDSSLNTIFSNYYSEAWGFTRIQKRLSGDGYFASGLSYKGYLDNGCQGLETQQIVMRLDEQGEVTGMSEFGGVAADQQFHLHEEEDRIVMLGRQTGPGPCDLLDNYNEKLRYVNRELLETEDGFETLTEWEYFNFSRATVYFGSFPHEEGYYSYGWLSAEATLPEQPYWKGVLVNIDQNLDTLWSRRFFHYTSVLAEHSPAVMTQLDDGSFVGAGWVRMSPEEEVPWQIFPWLFRLDSEGCLEPGCQSVNVQEVVMGLDDALHIYPNPASDFATVDLLLPPDIGQKTQGDSRLSLTNALGELVWERALPSLSAGVPFKEQINVSDLPAGIYHIHLSKGSSWLSGSKLVVQ